MVRLHFFACRFQFSHHLLKGLSFPIEWSWNSCQKSLDNVCEGLLLRVLYSIYSLYICLYVSTTLIWILWLCSGFDIRKWVLHHCSFSKWFWLFGIPWDSMSIRVSFSISEKTTPPPQPCCWEFVRDCLKSLGCFGWYGHLDLKYSRSPACFPFVSSLLFSDIGIIFTSLLFPAYLSSNSLVRFISDYFILFLMILWMELFS